MESLLIRNSSKCRLTDKLQMRVPKNKILQICHSDGKIKIDEERIVENGIEVTGVVELRALYVVSDDEMPFYAAETALPFRHTIEVPGIGPDCRYELQSSIDQLSTTMPDSSDIEAKVVLNLNALVFRRRKEMVMQYVEEKDRTVPDYSMAEIYRNAARGRNFHHALGRRPHQRGRGAVGMVEKQPGQNPAHFSAGCGVEG